MGALWHPRAIRVRERDSGSFQGGGRKLVWHTTEGSSLIRYGGSAPHFTYDAKADRLWQHIPLDRVARALEEGGPNFWNAIQVELIGNAKETRAWSTEAYGRIAVLARWIEANFGVPRRTSVTFADRAERRYLKDMAACKAYAGHVGHQHIPGNEHWDPGRLRIERILEGAGEAGPLPRDLRRGDRGTDVRRLQRVLVRRGYEILRPHVDGNFTRATEAFVVHFQWRHGLNPDGVAGASTRAALGME